MCVTCHIPPSERRLETVGVEHGLEREVDDVVGDGLVVLELAVALTLIVARAYVQTRAYGGDHPALVLDELGQGLQSVQRDGTRLDVDLVEPQLHIIHDTLN